MIFEIPTFENVGKLRRELSYGENPHQRGAIFVKDENRPSVANADFIQNGENLSYNNLLDADAAFELVADFKEPTVAIVKHGIPCGVASRETLCHAFSSALGCDPKSAFGGVVACNETVDEHTAETIIDRIFHVVVAPKFTDKALDMLFTKRTIRLLETGGMPDASRYGFEVRSIGGGILVQERNDKVWDAENVKSASSRKLFPLEIPELEFAYRVCKHVKSNAIVVTGNKTAIGISGGQVSRIDAAEQAIAKAKNAVKNFKCMTPRYMASDGAIAFNDVLEVAAASGILGIIQPGGSKNDNYCTKKAGELCMSMIMTGTRQFRH